MQETLERVVGATRFRASANSQTIIRCTPSRDFACEIVGVVENRVTRNGLVELARVGANDLRQASLIVDGYLYETLARAVAVSFKEGGRPLTRMPNVIIDAGPVPQFRVVRGHWWHDVEHIVICNDETDIVRLRGLPKTQPFSAWANARIRSRFTRQLSLTTGLPRPSRQPGRSAG